jgi:adenylate cyclase
MSLLDDLKSDVSTTISQTWQSRDGQVVPTVDDVGLQAGGVNIDATFLYSDLADSTSLATWNRLVAAKIYKVFLACNSRIIRSLDGEIRSFDGDRVMAVFIGDRKSSRAAECALKINYAFQEIIKPAVINRYKEIRDGTHTLAHCTGIDAGNTLVARSGIRGNNDLVWVGRAPNIAAKLATIRDSGYYSFITEASYKVLVDTAKMNKSGKPMWERRVWEGMVVYRSNWTWTP